MHQKNAVFLFVILLVLFTNFTASGQENNPKQKEEALEADSNQDVLHEDMKKFKQMFLEYQQSRQPQVNVRDVEFDLGENPVKGSSSARLMIIQFSDYTCHYCARHSRETFPEIDKNYIKTGKIRYAIIDYPWPGNVPAMNASLAAHCAHEQGKFWEMHRELTTDPTAIDDLNAIAEFIELDMKKFTTCVETEKCKNIVSLNIQLGSDLNIPSVPGFIIAFVDQENPQKVKGISYIRGAKPYAHFQQEIEKAISGLSE